MSGPGDSQRSIFPSATVSFSLDTFSSKDFIVKEFIEDLSKSSVAVYRRSGGSNAFDPKPYIRSFEGALGRLRELDQDLSERESELKEAVRRAELDHTRTIERLGDKFNQTLGEFQKLDTTISDGEGVAVQIGGQLEQLDKQRQRAEEAMFLIQCYSDFSRGDSSRLEKLRKSGKTEDSIRCAIVARQLSIITKRLEASGTVDQTKELVEKFSETLEKDLLRQFDKAYRKSDWEMMRGCAKVLTDFNGGGSVTQIFVNQHDFFINVGNLVTGEIVPEGEIWERLPDPDLDPPGLEDGLVKLIDEVKYVVQNESAIVSRVFPQPDQVLGKFIQRVFQQSIQQKLEMVLETASSLSSLAFLRMLQSAKTYVSTLVEDLKQHGLTEHPGPLSSSTTLILDQNLEELFIPYLGGNNYIEKEKNALETLYSGLLLKFNLFHSRKKRMQNMTYMDRLKIATQKVSADARDKAIEKILESDIGKSRSDVLTRIMGVNKENDKEKSSLNDIETTEFDGQLSVEAAKRMLRWLAEAVGRSLELSPSTDTPKDVHALLQILIEHMRKIYVETAIDAALDSAEQKPSQEPDLTYLVEVKPATTIMHLMFTFINTALLPLASSSLTVRRDMTILTNQSLSNMESKINQLIQKTIDLILAHVSTLLNKQKKQDFRPKDDEVSLTTMRTAVCQSVTLFLEKAHDIAKESLDGANLEFFLSEVGSGVRTLLLEHFKKYQVNAAGALMLTKDVVAYHDLIRNWNVPTLKESFELLQELSSLFVIGPAALKDKLRDGVLIKVKPSLLRPYLSRRDDFQTAGIDKLLTTDVA